MACANKLETFYPPQKKTKQKIKTNQKMRTIIKIAFAIVRNCLMGMELHP